MERQMLVGLVTAAQGGDGAAMDRLFGAFYDDIYYFALKTVKDQELACDITQETFVVAITAIRELKEPAAFVTWLKQIAFSQCTRYFRKKKEVLVDEGEDGETVFDILAEDRAEFIPDEAVDQEDFRNTILAMLDELSEEQRSAVMLYYYDELSVRQIAQIQGVSEGTVKSRLNYARKAIRRSVEDYEKKHDVRLHSVALLPLLYWIFAGSRKAMPVAAVEKVAGAMAAAGAGSAGAAGAGSVGVAGAAAAKAVGTGLAVKVVAGITAVALVAGGIGIASRLKDTEDKKEQTTQTSGVASDVGQTDGTHSDAGQTDGEDLLDQGIVPMGCRYVTADGVVLAAGEKMPQLQSGDELVTEAFTYKYGYECMDHSGNLYKGYHEGWGVRVDDRTRTEYPTLRQTINGAPVTSLDYAFVQCGAMVEAPKIPESVRYMSHCFEDCAAMETAPTIPDGVVDVATAFSGCASMKAAPKLPEGVEDLAFTFARCSSLETVPPLPDSVTNMRQTFYRCSSLKEAPRIPDGVTDLRETFKDCVSLVTAPQLPQGVQDVMKMFSGCTALEHAPAIPEGIRDVGWMFENCASLKVAPAIPEGVEEMFCTFNGCLALEEAPVLPSTVTDIGHCFGGCEALEYPPVLPDGLRKMSYAFFDCKALKERPRIPDSVEDQNAAFWGCDQLPEE